MPGYDIDDPHNRDQAPDIDELHRRHQDELAMKEHHFQQDMALKHHLHQQKIGTMQNLHQQQRAVGHAKLKAMIADYMHNGGDPAHLRQMAQMVHHEFGNPELTQLYSQAADGWGG
jgi:hypothetical protein